MPAPRLSVIIITKNEAHRIERCLRSVAFADEIVLVDCGSTDATVELAARLGARTCVTPDWPGFGAQKNRALALASGDWVLSIDADEVVSDDLRRAIEAVVGAGGASGDGARAVDAAGVPMPRGGSHAASPGGWWVLRRSTFCGTPVRHGDWRNDRVLRLFRRGAAHFSDDLVHERVICEVQQATLTGLLLHDSVDSLRDGIEKSERYARLGAARLRARGRGGVAQALGHGAWAFVRGYLLRLGFLDGRAGLAIASLNARGTYLRYLLAGRPDAAGAPASPVEPEGDRP